MTYAGVHTYSVHSKLPKPTRTISPTATCSDSVVISLSTQIVIPNFARFYETPIRSFRPAYRAFSDGSLVARPMMNDIFQTQVLMFLNGFMLMFFLRNSVTSIYYLHKGRMKYKTLFYVLLVSQVLGQLCMLTMLTAVFVPVNCYLVNVAAAIFAEVSYSMLLTGALGVKAYRCLERSRWVLSITLAFQSASTSLVAVALFHLRSFHLLSGACGAEGIPRLVMLIGILRMLQSAFLCICFLYALWKSSVIPATHGRISLNFSDQSANCPVVAAQRALECSSRARGWWDYVPEKTEAKEPCSESWIASNNRSFLTNLRFLWHSVFASKKTAQKVVPPRIRITSQSQHLIVPSPLGDQCRSPAPTIASRLRRLMISMPLFREMMNHELSNTAFVTFGSAVTMALSLATSHSRGVAFPSIYMVATNWSALSSLVVYNFGRVVERHEREALLQHPSAWDPAYQIDHPSPVSIRREGSRMCSVVNSVPSFVSPRASRNSAALRNPFADFEVESSRAT